MRMHVISVALLAGGLASGCAFHNGQEPADGPDPLAMEPASPDAPLMLHVNNRNWEDMDVYAVRLGSRLRLGTISSMMSRDFKVPAAFLTSGDFQVLVAPIGESRGFLTQPMLLGAGQAVDVQVETSLNLSSVFVH